MSQCHSSEELVEASGSLSSSFENSKELQKFVLTDVTPTGKSLGAGSYGSVEEVYMHVLLNHHRSISCGTGKGVHMKETCLFLHTNCRSLGYV